MALHCLAAPAGAVTITTFPIGNPTEHLPQYIASSPTGDLWFTDLLPTPAVRGINSAGASLGSINYPSAPPTGDLAFAPKGDLYWASGAGFGLRKTSGELSRYTRENFGEASAVGFRADGTPRVTGYSDYAGGFYVCSQTENCGSFTPTANGWFSDLILGSDGHLWALQPKEDRIRRLDGGGLVTELSVNLPAGSHPLRATVGPDGNLWIAAFGTGYTEATNKLNQVIRLTPTGEQKSFILPPGRGPDDITLGPDGALWFTEYLSNSIGRITTTGEYSSCPLPNAADAPGPFIITTGTDGALWFTEEEVGAIGRLTGGNCALSPAVLPVAPAGGATPGGSVGGPAGGSKGTPALSGLKVTPSAIDPTKGAKVTFTLSAPAPVTFAVQRKARGRKVGKSCKPQTRANADSKPCSRRVAVKGSLRRDGVAGQNTFTFKGRIGGHLLGPGNYVLSAEVANVPTGASAPFSILR
jgi:virginiamycin B lyase